MPAHRRGRSRTPPLTHAIEYLGRLDVQVKLRGFRIQLGEIEARLAEHPAVREAVVAAREDAPGDTRLVAYVSGDAPDAEALRAHLAQHLPEYMVPAAYVRLDALPLTPNGKVDRTALPAPERDACAGPACEAPAGDTEQVLAAIWCELLRVERVGCHDDFFGLGGHSLLAARVASRASERLETRVSATEVFFHPRLAPLARAVDQARAAHPGEGPAGQGDRPEDVRPYSVDMLSDDDVDTLLAQLLAQQADP